MTDDDWDYTPDDDLTRDCECDAPDPTSDEPWVPTECANCGGLM